MALASCRWCSEVNCIFQKIPIFSGLDDQRVFCCLLVVAATVVIHLITYHPAPPGGRLVVWMSLNGCLRMFEFSSEVSLFWPCHVIWAAAVRDQNFTLLRSSQWSSLTTLFAVLRSSEVLWLGAASHGGHYWVSEARPYTYVVCMRIFRHASNVDRYRCTSTWFQFFDNKQMVSFL